jgi:virginiamycin B lyase
MVPLVLRRIVLGSFALALLAAPAARAAPVGLIEEFRMHANVGGIAAGPEGNLWFTLNTPFGKNKRVAIGRIAPTGKVTKFRAGLSAKTEPSEIAAGSDGNLWFTYDPGIAAFGGGGVGRITPQGRITEFPEPPELHGSPFEIVAGPDGNLWFGHAAILTPTGQAIGRITPQGEISEFSAGLDEGAAVTNLVAGPDGNVWFGDDSSKPAIGRITPSGEITEFGGIPPREFPILEGPAPGPDGKLWFSANEPAPAVERISSAGTIERFAAGLGKRVEDVGPFVTGAGGKVWFGIEKHPPRGQRETERGLTAIGSITAGGGKIAEFSRCLRPMPSFSGPNFLTRGPDGNVWFTTWPSGEDTHPTRASIPSIGRVTPAGRITEFRLGLHERSQPESLTSAGGSLWFIDREANSIGRIVPPRAPANTFLVLSAKHPQGSDVTRLPVAVPGPGTLRLRLAGQGTIARKARNCGTTVLSIHPRGSLRKEISRRGAVRTGARIAFTPRGGSPYSQKRVIALR